MRRIFCMVVLCAAVLSACGEDPEVLVEAWSGRWAGPEGTSLEITKQPGYYEVKIVSLDGVRVHMAQPVRGGLEFSRDDIPYVIRAGDGAATGMKWLSDKQNCLIVKKGEGYCRD